MPRLINGIPAKEYRDKYNKAYYKAHQEELKSQKKKYYKDNHEERKRVQRERYWKKTKEQMFISRYGLTLKQVDDLLLKQDHKCAICGCDLKETKRCVDHNHKTGEFRGILCDLCNKGLGHFRDSIEILKKAVAYLAKT